LVARVPVSHDDDDYDDHANGGRQEHEGQEDEKHYFIKTSTKKSESCSREASEMFRGEYESLNAIADVVPEMCPRPLAWGKIEPEDDDNSIEEGWFLATEFLDLHGGSGRVGRSLARRLAMLHNTAAPPPPVQTGPRVINVRESSNGGDDDSSNTPLQYGFPVPTFCGDVKQPNRFHRSWASFYANQRLRTVLAESEKRNGPDRTLHDLVERVATTLVPRLLGDTHLGYDTNGNGHGIYPVVVHGDLWSGNAGRGTISRSSRMVPTSGPGEEVGDVIYDPAGCYAHSEFDLGIMHMFGGFGPDFYSEYHRLVPKTEPVHEYDDRVALYEL
jgi:fructosamine-3-kinase